MRMPPNISYATFDDVSWFPLLNPPVTAISQPVGEMGTAAARMLPEMVEGRGRPESMILEARLVVRGSCSAMPDG
jgi:LacI family transcriptional regulator